MAKRKYFSSTDWDLIKEMFIGGMYSYADLATRFGVAPRTLRQRAYRERWADHRRGADGRTLVDPMMQPQTPEEIVQELEANPAQLVKVSPNEWEVLINEHVLKVHAFLKTREMSNWKEAEVYVMILEKLNKIQRANLGLDLPGAGQHSSALALIDVGLLKDSKDAVVVINPSSVRNME